MPVSSDLANVDPTSFESRHIGPSAEEQATMLTALGYADLDQLTEAAIPPSIRADATPTLPPARSEAAVAARLRELADRNRPLLSMIGLGYAGTITPPVIRRNVLEDPAWYTAYTPYQPEISQGRLEALVNFQTMIADLTGLSTAGSSLLDEATAVAEAIAIAHRARPKKVAATSTVLLDGGLLPQSIAVVRTRARAMGWQVEVADTDLVQGIQTHDPFVVVVQVPGTDGRMPSEAELRQLADKAHENDAMVIAAADPMALVLSATPGQWGADIAVGSTQRFGVPLFHGGPHAGYICVRAGLERQLPGRLVGVSKDAHGNPAYRLALQTREQHIRREKATSNICTAQVLLAVVASMYAVFHGPTGLTAIATAIHQRTRRLAAGLVEARLAPVHDDFFDTLLITAAGRGAQLVATAEEVGIHVRAVDADHVGVSVGEDTSDADLARLLDAWGASLPSDGHGGMAGHVRSADFLTHPVFRSHHSETEMLRYLRTLSERDFALDRGMIPLGSCTMKLNATTEMEPISLPGFANVHPFVPAAHAQGYRELIAELEMWLAEITGYDRVSLQPNAGSQGELAGLLAIRAYHVDRGEPDRTICLIPASAHGTNAASAAMAGLSVVVVRTAEDGSVDLVDLRTKIDQHRDELAGIMVTYPSTHGVYEETITELCALVHDAGGQVYVDGANLNALMGLARPGKFGADVSHLNLHKTFCIPHGGGGPGVGPVAVREHLAGYLPNHPIVTDAGPDSSYGPVSAAPWGSAGILPISYAFIALMGADGLTHASQVALLNANYIAQRLGDYFPILYTGRNGLVAHECILDLRSLTKASGVSVDDVAKRLIDHGFHAPTMSFPVAGTLMVEPTESESLAELDRFCEAMIAIRHEIDKVSSGEWGEDNPLANAPHTVHEVTADDWHHPYSRTEAGWPSGRQVAITAGPAAAKYWSPVGRVDGAYGDRNLQCSCPPISDWQD